MILHSSSKMALYSIPGSLILEPKSVTHLLREDTELRNTTEYSHKSLWKFAHQILLGTNLSISMFL